MKKIEQTKINANNAERDGDLNLAAELKYGKLVELKNEIDNENKRLVDLQKDRQLLKEEVEEEDIAQIVAKWDRYSSQPDA